MYGGVKRLMDYAEGNVGKELGMMVDELGAMGEAWDYGELTKASSELYSLLVRYAKEEAATVVKGVHTMCGIEAYGRLHGTYSGRTMGRLFRLQR